MKKIIILSLIAFLYTNSFASSNTTNNKDIKIENNKNISTEQENFKSKLIKELEITLDKISEKDNERKLQVQKELDKMKLEREALDKARSALEKERVLKGIITKDDVERDKQKLEEQKRLLMQKMQLKQTQEQLNLNDIDVYKKALNGRINYFKNLKKELKKEYVITPEYYDYVEVKGIINAYISITKLKDILNENNIVLKNEESLNLKISSLESAKDLEILNDIKQVLNMNSINNYKAETYTSSLNNSNNSSTSSYTKIVIGQKLSDTLYVKNITPDNIIIERK